MPPATDAAEAEQPLNFTRWDSKQLRFAIEAAGVALWCWNVDTDHFRMDERGFDLWDLPPAPFVIFEDLSAKIHPADRDRVRAAFSATRGLIGRYEIDFRILLADDVVRWISARGKGSDADIKERSMFGIFLDVTGRKQAEESSELLAGEMSHRVKNLLSIAATLASISSRSANSAAEMAADLTLRLGALGRANELALSVRGDASREVLLGDLLAILLAPYDNVEAFAGRIRVAVPRTPIGPSSAATLTMVLHELATNSAKYGALSAHSGMLDVSTLPHDDQIIIVWTESGGPPVAPPTADSGFGTALLKQSVRALRGVVDHNWAHEGAVITVTLDKARLAR